MNKFYFTFSTSLIDGILMTTNQENYGTPTLWENDIQTGGFHFRDQEDTKYAWSPLTQQNKERYPKSVFVRNQYKLDAQGNKIIFDGRDRRGPLLKTIDECVYNFFEGQYLRPSIDDQLDYEQEFSSELMSSRTCQMLLFMKWIAGLQSIQKVPFVQITKKDLEELGITNISTLDLKKSFDIVFKRSQLPKNTWEDGVWTVSVGPKDRMVGEGPGYIKIRIDQPYFLELIQNHHQKLRQQKIEELANTLT